MDRPQLHPQLAQPLHLPKLPQLDQQPQRLNLFQAPWTMVSLNAVLVSAVLFLALLLQSGAHSTNQTLASTPPRGWNSYDSYSWIISEDEFLQNAQLVADKLLPYGYEYVVVDFLWYRRRESGASVTSRGFDTIDEWGRPIPDPARWPSSAGGQGFKPVADKVHAMGLKFGIHVMRGISTQAVEANTPVFGIQGSPDGTQNRIWRARDIALTNRPCSWMSACFVSVDESTEGGQAFIKSLYDLYASWEVDYVKHDCVFGVDDLSVQEITAVSQAITATGRPMLYSISPGVRANPSMAMVINGLVNLYRVTSDDWDSWNDVQSHFDVARDFAAAGLVGASGLLGLSWPDLDMLPLGYLTDPGANYGPYRFSRLTLDEQKTQVTLWAMAKSPLMFGGDMLNLDQTTLGLITNPTMLGINANSFGNMELPGSSSMGSMLPVLSLLECEDATATRWSIGNSTTSGDLDQICWVGTPGTKGMDVAKEPGGCLHWQLSTLNSTPEYSAKPSTRRAARDQMKLSGQASLKNSFAEEICLDSQANRSSSFSSFRSQYFSPCSQDRSQVWKLNPEGKLVSETTELCAAVAPVKHDISVGELMQTNNRIWIARGPEGEYYVAFFNLGKKSSTMSVPLVSIMKAGLPNIASCDIVGASQQNHLECRGQEVWSSKDIGTVHDVLSAQVPSHGCALFYLQCG